MGEKVLMENYLPVCGLSCIMPSTTFISAAHHSKTVLANHIAQGRRSLSSQLFIHRQRAPPQATPFANTHHTHDRNRQGREGGGPYFSTQLDSDKKARKGVRVGLALRRVAFSTFVILFSLPWTHAAAQQRHLFPSLPSLRLRDARDLLSRHPPHPEHEGKFTYDVHNILKFSTPLPSPSQPIISIVFFWTNPLPLNANVIFT